ncbi:hypothetical protein GOP47_0002829 [Adiantum capillus-veneris]|uniref:Pre-mRNA processing factor 4 (PRP4)-like domain-containing protein n=1 Tax=Adiantum capillus-veneris TaxID=13818 RepID=A0A9D4VAT6_ADICA|nr:hypothetical protein GOP47_0002829 [Adiantum capillus-veneris]
MELVTPLLATLPSATQTVTPTSPSPGSTTPPPSSVHPFPPPAPPALHPPGVGVFAGAEDHSSANGDANDGEDTPMHVEPQQSPPHSTRSRKEEPAPEYDVSEESRKAKERQEQALQQVLLNRRAKALAVPTNDAIVRSRLRSLDQPITLFGEREMERRQRLRDHMALLDSQGELDRYLTSTHAFAAALADDGAAKEDERMEEVQTVPFFTEGSNELLQARIELMKYSLSRAASRISRMKLKRENPDEDEDAELDYVLQRMSQISMNCSQIGDDRPLSGCAFSPDGAILATSGWSGATKIWNVETMERAMTLRGHTERVTSVAFSPAENILATASADRTAILWGLDGSCLRKFEGHLDRLARIAFHPSGAYLGTASFDKTWRLWDVNTGIELLLQEGHSRTVYGVAFQCDGSLVATCGLDALARVWDLRTGRSILALEGHVKPVLGIDFSPNGYHLATGGEDHTCRIWDLRKRRTIYIIPAHNNLVSQVKYEPYEGYVLVTASHDNTCKVWSARDFKPVKTLAGHEGKVMGVDVTGDGQLVASASYDRTIKLWGEKS